MGNGLKIPRKIRGEFPKHWWIKKASAFPDADASKDKMYPDADALNDVGRARRNTMLTKKEKETIISCAKKYNVSSLYLFGSALDHDNTEAQDIDLGVKGIAPELFFKFYGELMRRLSKRVDLVNLSKKCLFNDLVEERGVKIYG